MIRKCVIKFDSLVMASQLFHVSLRTFREDYIKGKNQKRSYLLPILRLIVCLVLANFKIHEFFIIQSINLGDPRAMERENRQARNFRDEEKREEEEKNKEN